jgi:hypothetical protein
MSHIEERQTIQNNCFHSSHHTPIPRREQVRSKDVFHYNHISMKTEGLITGTIYRRGD